ncbi:MAG: tail fiber domain-containing protein, partial [bacterium]|nr:tail fiber domain-containing protein [bacterium]
LSVVGTAAISGLTANAGVNYAVCINNATGELLADSGGDCAVSSERYKHNISDLKLSGLDVITALNPAQYTYNNSNGVNYGFIAEAAANVNSNLATYEADGVTPHGLDTNAFLSVIVKAMQEQQLEIGSLTATVATSSSRPGVSFVENLFDQFMSMLSSAVVFAKSLFIENLTVGSEEKPSGITLYDEVTKEPYCLKMVNGEMKSVSGICTTNNTDNTTAVINVTQNQNTNNAGTTTTTVVATTTNAATSTDSSVTATSTASNVEIDTADTVVVEVVPAEDPVVEVEDPISDPAVETPSEETIIETGVSEQETETVVVEELAQESPNTSDIETVEQPESAGTSEEVVNQ